MRRISFILLIIQLVFIFSKKDALIQHYTTERTIMPQVYACQIAGGKCSGTGGQGCCSGLTCAVWPGDGLSYCQEPGGGWTFIGAQPVPQAPATGCSAGQIANVNCLMSTVSNILVWGVYLSGVLAVILIIYAGIEYITSAGDQQKIAHAKQIFTYVIIGAVVIAMAYIILGLISSITGVAEISPG